MTELPPDPASGDAPDAWPYTPITGVFLTSWWGALKWSVWVYGGLLIVAAALAALTADPALRFGLAFGGALVVARLGMEAVAYRVWGARRIEITPEALVVERRGGRTETVRWADLREAYYRSREGGDSWLFRHGHERTTLPERGFTVDDWLAIRQGIDAWKASGPLATLPGVETERQRPGPQEAGPVFKAHQPSALFWGIPFFAFGGVVGLASSWEAYGDGSWPEDLMMSVGLPVSCFGFVALAVWRLSRAARRITFGPRAMLVERYIGPPIAVPYADVYDVWGNQMKTYRATINIGDRNQSTFQRLLAERLAGEQLSGDMMVHAASGLESFGLQMGVLFACLVGGAVVGWAFGLGEGNTVALSLGLVVIAAVVFTVQSRRRAKRWIAEAEREAAGGASAPEASGGS
ncbi:MAG: hypothetical protein AAFQ43_03050 [Bacteroidota bacterium]